MNLETVDDHSLENKESVIGVDDHSLEKKESDVIGVDDSMKIKKILLVLMII